MGDTGRLSILDVYAMQVCPLHFPLVRGQQLEGRRAEVERVTDAFQVDRDDVIVFGFVHSKVVLVRGFNGGDVLDREWRPAFLSSAPEEPRDVCGGDGRVEYLLGQFFGDRVVDQRQTQPIQF